MSLQLAAQHLSNHGRGKDSTLVHMSPREVSSLNALAQAHGGHLTTNPHTGLPEAGFLESILPMVAGFALDAAVPGLGEMTGLGSMAVPAIVGGGTALLTGSLGKGLMAGLGAYGGAGLGEGLAKSGMDAAISGDTAAQAAQKEMIANANSSEFFNPTHTDLNPGMADKYAAAQNAASTNYADAVAKLKPTGLMDSLGMMGKGIGSLGESGGISNLYKNLGGSPMSLLKTVGSAAAPAIFSAMTPKQQNQAPVGDANMGQRYGFSMNPTSGQPQQTQPGQNPPGTPQTTTPFPTPDLYGREQRYFAPSYTKLTPEEAKKMYGYAQGGNVQLQGHVTMDDQGGGQFGQTGFGQQNVNGYQAAGSGFAGNNNSAPKNQEVVPTNPYQSDNLPVGKMQSYEDYLNGPQPAMVGYKPVSREEFNANQIQNEQQRKAGFFGLEMPQGGLQGGLGGLFGNMGQASSYAEGGIADEDRPTETPALQMFKQMQAQRAAQPQAPQIDANAQFNQYAQQTLGTPNQPQTPPTIDPTTIPTPNGYGYMYNPVTQKYTQVQGTPSTTSDPNADAQNPVIDQPFGGGMNRNNITGHAAGGGISDAGYNLGGYSDGGRLLRGPGDGVSDSIPAVIGKKQPARLADGEFVIPARIVSELGNGSTEAGARKLYAMMDRIQSARGKTVGKGKVAKNSRSEKYLPA